VGREGRVGGRVEGSAGGIVDTETFGLGSDLEFSAFLGFETEVEKVFLESAVGGRGVEARITEGFEQFGRA